MDGHVGGFIVVHSVELATLAAVAANNHHTVRTLLDFFSPIPNSRDIQIQVLQDNIEWARNEKRIFLKHNLETRLVAWCVDTNDPTFG